MKRKHKWTRICLTNHNHYGLDRISGCDTYPTDKFHCEHAHLVGCYKSVAYTQAKAELDAYNKKVLTSQD